MALPVNEQKIQTQLNTAVAENATMKAKIQDLEAALGLGDDHLGVIFKLPISLTKLLGLLMAVPNVTPEMIQLRLQIATDAKVAVHRLRLAMAKSPHFKDENIIQSRRGLGYWLDAPIKDRIKAMVTTQGNDEPVQEDSEEAVQQAA